MRQKLEPGVVERLQSINNNSQASFNKVYTLGKDFKKGVRRFYQPKPEKKADVREDFYTIDFLKSIGVVPTDSQAAE